MEAKLSTNVKKVIVNSRDEAIRLGSGSVGVEHIFLGMIREKDCSAIALLTQMNVDILSAKMKIENAVRNNMDVKYSPDSDIPMLRQAEKVLRLSFLESQKWFKSKEIHTIHILLAIFVENENLVCKILEKSGISYQQLSTLYKATHLAEEEGRTSSFNSNDETSSDFTVRNDINDDDDDTIPYSSHSNQYQERSQPDSGSRTPALENFGRDLTKAAEENRLDPIVGREKELERIAQILSRRKKNNPILIGEPGVGKSAIAEGLAIRIVEGKVPRTLYNKRVITLDLASLVAGTKYRGQFEERMKAIIKELEKNPDIIVFIDEIHTIVGAGNASGSLDASNMFKPALARGEIQCIGATTIDEYRQYIEKDGALERRFQKVFVEATSPEETLTILNNIKSKYEDHHLVTYSEEALKACVSLTTRYITDRLLPDKAIDAMDEVGARVHITNIEIPPEILNIEKEISRVSKLKKEVLQQKSYNEAAEYRDQERELTSKLEALKKNWENEEREKRVVVSEQDVAEVVAMMSGIPIQRIAENESNRLMLMEKELEDAVIGQNEAIKKITKAIRRNRAGLKDPNKPIGSFIFLGPTGVGKTYLAKVLARYLFDTEASLIRIDMSEYMEKFTVSRLVGAPPGYVGYEEGGQLTEKIRHKPYSIVLLDEIEKAHPDVFNILLQVLDDGQLTDGLGRKVDFKNTIVIMTSNIGSRQLKDFGTGVGFATTARESNKASMERSVIENAMKKAFSPEFLNRIDDVIIFNSLTRKDIHKIIDIELRGLFKRIQSMGYNIDITEAAKDIIQEKGWDENYGARPLKRAIQKYIEDELAEEIIKSTLLPGDSIVIDADENKEIKFIISKGTESLSLQEIVNDAMTEKID
jgi:ATP-dependent Clp protease ATP-binding subunit ClpC